MLPELQEAVDWQRQGLSEMLSEMHKQVLPDGADFESSTGYHKFVTELFLYSFLLAERNGVDIPQEYRAKLVNMLDYIQGASRPDGHTPLIGDADGSQIIPIVRREPSDPQYLVAIGSAMGMPISPVATTPEVGWLLGSDVEGKAEDVGPVSKRFPNSGANVLVYRDLYLHLNTSDCGVYGRGSHAHNDALSIEVAAMGRPFIIDPGSYAYNLDREARHQFRSTGYHSTITVDGAEQNTIEVDLPFVIGNQARPKVLEFVTSDEVDQVTAEHYGYERLQHPVRHGRQAKLNKSHRYWRINDLISGYGEHDVTFAFHLAPGLSIGHLGDDALVAADTEGRSLIVDSDIPGAPAEILPAWCSRNYGHKEESTIVRWTARARMPFTAAFYLIPVTADENLHTRLETIRALNENTV